MTAGEFPPPRRRTVIEAEQRHSHGSGRRRRPPMLLERDFWLDFCALNYGWTGHQTQTEPIGDLVMRYHRASRRAEQAAKQQSRPKPRRRRGRTR